MAKFRKGNLAHFATFFDIAHGIGSDDKPMERVWRQSGRETKVVATFSTMKSAVDQNQGFVSLHIKTHDLHGYGMDALLDVNEKYRPGTSDIPAKLASLTLHFPDEHATRRIRRHIKLTENRIGPREIVNIARIMAVGERYRGVTANGKIDHMPQHFIEALAMAQANRIIETLNVLMQTDILDPKAPMRSLQTLPTGMPKPK